MGAEDARKLFVGGLSESVTEESLRSAFESAGFEIAELGLPRDRQTGNIRGFAFVTLTEAEHVAAAITQLSGVQLGGRALSLRPFQQGGGREGRSEDRKREGGGERRSFDRGRDSSRNEPSLFLGKLPFEATREEIEGLFGQVGLDAPKRVTLPLGPDGRPRGFGFATLAEGTDVAAAVDKLSGQFLNGRQIVVNEARARESRGRESRDQGDGGRAPMSRGPGPGRGFRSGGPGGQPSGAPDRPDDERRSSSHRPPRQWDNDWSGSSPEPEPMPFPPQGGAEMDDGRRRRPEKKNKKEKKRGNAGAAERRPARRERGGGSNWHKWENDD
ncbi:MAG: hypothetical protein MK135_09115 [Polyangiaceae bacterium]|nr:hypothetical protein [Polyangiaceae bacterium]